MKTLITTVIIVAVVIGGATGFGLLQQQRQQEEMSREAIEMQKGAEQFSKMLSFKDADKPLHFDNKPAGRSPSPVAESDR
jgi:hypothetical protein